MPTTIQIVNNRGDEDTLNLLLTANSQQNLSGITSNCSTKLSDMPKDSSGNITISFDSIDGARLYVGYGHLPTSPLQPDPNSTQYYGWIEFTKKPTDTGVYINLSNVDVTGLPLALAGQTEGGSPWTLGYNIPITEIIQQLQTNALNSPSCSALVTCDTGQLKVVGPNKQADCYASFDTYLNSLTAVSAKLSITSDAPATTFTGTFLPAVNDDDVIIHLTGDNGMNLDIHKRDFTSKIIYSCDGGLIYYYNTKDTPPSPNTVADSRVRHSLFLFLP